MIAAEGAAILLIAVVGIPVLVIVILLTVVLLIAVRIVDPCEGFGRQWT